MKTKIIITGIILIALFFNLQAQYHFTDEIKLPCTKVKNQQWTGTCWSFSTTSFLESEIIRMGKDTVDISEMYNARMTYMDKAQNYVLRHGKANFGQGGLAHDVFYNVKKYGIMPESIYSGTRSEEAVLDDNELIAVLKAFLDAVIKTGSPKKYWKDAFNGILDAYMGTVPSVFTYNGKNYNPKSFTEELGINPDAYVHFSSFTHHPFNEYFILEIPDNFSNGSYFNITIDEIMDVINTALEAGYTIIWDGDFSEKWLSQQKGIAILPAEPSKDSLFEKPCEEIEVTQELRQEEFENYKTLDDHLIQIVGRAKDQDGKTFYIIKNSWGEMGTYKGYLYMSETFIKMKTISISVHKDALPKEIAKKL